VHKFVKGLAIIVFFICAQLSCADPILRIERDQPPPLAKPGDLNDIFRRGYFRVAMVHDLPPFVTIPKTGQPHGIDIDLVKKIAERMGVQAHIQVVSKPADLSIWVEKGLVDFAASDISMTSGSTQTTYFAMPYLVANFAMLVNRYQAERLGLDQTLKSYNQPSCRLGYLQADSNVPILDYLFKHAHRQSFPDFPSAVQALKTGKIDAIFRGAVTLRHYYTLDPDNAFNMQLIILPGFYMFSGIAQRFSSRMLGDWLQFFIKAQYADKDSVLSQVVRDYRLTYAPAQVKQAGGAHAT
jgi:ABC-type amino acid transport substrate-binding protein